MHMRLQSIKDTQKLAEKCAAEATKGTVFALQGPLGSGKTTFAQCFIRHLLGKHTDVPSPTFTLVNLYEQGDIPIYHADLHRLEAEEELYELGLEEAFEEGITLIEWPEIAESWLPKDTIRLQFELDEAGKRSVILDT